MDLRRIYLTPRDLTAWLQQYRDDKCTKQLYSVWILPVNYKQIKNRHACRIDPSTQVLTASWRDSASGVGGQCCWTLSWRCEFCSPFIHTHSPVLELLLLYFSKKRILNEVRVDTYWQSKPSLKLVDCGRKIQNYLHIDNYHWKPELITWR